MSTPLAKLRTLSVIEGREIVFGGTDHGLVTMATTDRMPLKLFDQKLSSDNRNAILANFGTDDPMLTDNHIQASAIFDNANNVDQKAAVRNLTSGSQHSKLTNEP